MFILENLVYHFFRQLWLDEVYSHSVGISWFVWRKPQSRNDGFNVSISLEEIRLLQ